MDLIRTYRKNMPNSKYTMLTVDVKHDPITHPQTSVRLSEDGIGAPSQSHRGPGTLHQSTNSPGGTTAANYNYY